jgi:hypothetical protein
LIELGIGQISLLDRDLDYSGAVPEHREHDLAAAAGSIHPAPDLHLSFTGRVFQEIADMGAKVSGYG